MIPGWTDLSIGVAALAMLVYVIRTMRSIIKDNQEFMSTHITLMTRAMESTAQALDLLTATTNLNHEKTIRSHTVLANRLGGKIGAALTEAMAEENGEKE